MERVEHLIKQINHPKSYALCVIVETKGSTPAKTGTKLIVNEDGSIVGTIGGGRLEKTVIADALRLLGTGQPELFRHDLLHQHSMCCGGTVYVYIEPQMMKPKLYIFGAGHTGQALAALSVDMGFDLFVIDERKELMQQITLPEIHKMNLPHALALQALVFDQDTYICIMTHDHAIDREILAYCITRPHAYLGMIGSSRKVEVTRKMFTEGKIATEEQLADVEMPMGINILAESPKEIAVSILARLIEIKNKKHHE